MNNTTRRRFIGISAALSASAMLPNAFAQTAKTTPTALEPVIWRGTALGAEAELRLYHPNRAIAENLIQKALAEVSRLEKVFSVYDDNSQVSQLNRTGLLNAPSADLLAVLSQAKTVNTLTAGAFDPTVQVLWQTYAQHFAKNPHSSVAPNLQAALNKVGLKYVFLESQRITFFKRDMAITLNGIAQGYITDRVTQLLQNSGMQHALVNMGELRHFDKLKQHTEMAKIQNPRGNGTIPNQHIPLQNKALATSGGYGTKFDAVGKFTHLFDPRTGSSTPRYQSVSVLADTAAMADALSTAFAVSSEQDIQAAATKAKAKVWLVMLDGSVKTIG